MSRNKKKKTGFIPQHQPARYNQIKELYFQAQQLQKQGYLENAAGMYHEILKHIPDQPDALHYLGLIHMNKGEIKLAGDYIRRSIRSSGNPIYYSNYGLLLTRQGKHEQAVEQYKKAIELQPAYAEAWYNLGSTLSELCRYSAAEDAYKKAISCRKDYIKALYGLASVQEEQGKSAEASATVEKIHAIIPDSADSFYTLGLALQYLGGSRNIRKAHDYLQKALELSPQSLEIYYALAKLFEEGNHIGSALEAYREILSIEPDYQDVRNRFANCLIKNDQVIEAEAEVRKLLDNDPENTQAQFLMGRIYTVTGKFEQAGAVYEKILEANQYHNGALSGLANGRKFTDKNDKICELLYEAVSRKKSATAWFALGKINNDLGEYDRAFDAYKRGNELKNRNTEYSPEEHTRFIDAIINVFSKNFVESMQAYGNSSRLPVFILGTPRSGTTLIEQILSSHPEVAGAGELTIISKLAKYKANNETANEKYPERIAKYSPEDLQNDALIYLDKIKTYQCDERVTHVTDKMPGNIFYLGYILILFPNAKIIHCRRNPLDSCLSMYFQMFQAEHQYSFDLENLGYWYKDYLRLVKHWRSIFGDRILDVDYDDTVNNTGDVARKLVAFCELDWDEKCLEFHKQDRSIHTASQWQARQPIYKSSLERWKRYDKHIGPLKDILAGYY